MTKKELKYEIKDRVYNCFFALFLCATTGGVWFGVGLLCPTALYENPLRFLWLLPMTAAAIAWVWVVQDAMKFLGATTFHMSDEEYYEEYYES